MIPGEQQRILYVRVINKSAENFTDMYDGVPITIEAGQSSNLTPEMAAHIFGYYDGVTRDQMFRYTSRRQGWNTPAHLQREGSKTLAERLFDNFDIKQIAYRMVEDTPDPDKPIPADPAVPEELPAVPRRPGRPARVAVS